MAAKTCDAVRRIAQDAPLRDLALRCAGTFLNFALAVFNAVVAQIQSSLWNHVMAGYFVVLTFLGSWVAMCMKRPDRYSARSVLYVCSFFMCALAIALGVLMGVCIGQHHSEQLPEILMIAMAAFTFGTTAVAVMDATRTHNGLPLQQVIARVSIAGAVGAVLVLEIQMLGTFGDPAGQLAFTIEAISGVVAVAVVFLMGLSLFRHANILSQN